MLGFHEQRNGGSQQDPEKGVWIQAHPVCLFGTSWRPYLGVRQACSCADGRTAPCHRGLHLVFPDKHSDELLSAVFLLLGLHRSDAADDLRPFFEEHVILPEGQDILRYDDSIDDKSTCNSLDNVITRFQGQRFLPLLHCIHDLQPSDCQMLISILTEGYRVPRMDPKEKWKKIEELLETYDARSKPRYYVRSRCGFKHRSKRSSLPTHILASTETFLSCAITC